MSRWVFTNVLVVLAASATPAVGQIYLHTLIGDDLYEGFGFALDGAGDVNGDGFDDFVIGAGSDNTAASEAGAVYVYSGIDGTELHAFYGAAAKDNLGETVAGAGDVNADGFADIIAGAFKNDSMGNWSGMARVYSGADGSVLYEYLGVASGSELGWAVGGAGDANGDGHDDLLISVHNQGLNGKVKLISGLDGSLIRELAGDGGSEGFGTKVDGAGDVNGDGFDDAIISMPQIRRARVFSGFDGAVLHTFDSPPGVLGDWAFDVAGAGDVNGDGLDDLIIGTPKESLIYNKGGMAQVLSGGDGSVLHTFYGWNGDQFLGWSVDGAGDVDNDGFDDLVVGAPFADTILNNGDDNGRVLVYSGADGSLLRYFTAFTTENGDQLGKAVAGAGDLNGDGFADVLGGSPGNDDVTFDSGKAYAYSLRYRVDEIDPPNARFNLPGTVSVMGQGFEQGTPIQVDFGGVPATNVSWVSANQVDCTPPLGLQGQVVDVTYSQNGLAAWVPMSLTYEGTTILDIFPPDGPTTGGDIVVLSGRHFVDDGSLTIDWGPSPATILQIEEPSVVVISTPPFPADDAIDVLVSSSAGSDFKPNLYGYEDTWVYPRTGGIEGGTLITISGEMISVLLEDATARVGWLPAQIISLMPGEVTIVCPAIEEATGQWLDIALMDVDASQHTLIKEAFLYTPYAASTYGGNTFEGLDLDVSFVAQAADEFVTLWIAEPGFSSRSPVVSGPQIKPGALTPPGAGGGWTPGGLTPGVPVVPKPAGGFGVPTVMLMVAVPLPEYSSDAFSIDLGTYDPTLIGTELFVQGWVYGVGDRTGTFTNVFKVPLD